MGKKKELQRTQKPEYFLIKINIRQDDFIQGQIEWLNQEDEQINSFNSLLECMNLLVDALERAKSKDLQNR